MKTNKLEPELLVSDAQGIYIPKTFADVFGIPENFQNWDAIKEDIEFLQKENSPEHIEYWDTWDELIDNAILQANGTTYYLYQNGDLWSVPSTYENNEFFEN